MKYRNINDGQILTERELNELHVREYFNQWYGTDTNDTVENFKEDGLTFIDYLAYQFKNDVDTDYVEIDENYEIKDKYLEKLLDYKEFLDEDDYDYIIEHEEVKEVSDCGMSGLHEGKHWYSVLLINGLAYDIYLD